MKTIVAYTIHERGGKKSASVIYNTLNENNEITGMNNRTEIEIGDEVIEAIRQIEDYLKIAMKE